MLKERPLGEIVRAVPALINLMNYIETRAASIYVRDYVNGELGRHALADLPAERALHWGFEFLKHCTIPIPIASQSGSHPMTEGACGDPECWCNGGNL